jgi:hypothetical protein
VVHAGYRAGADRRVVGGGTVKDKMTRLEKVAITSAVSGAVFNVFLFGIGATLATATNGPLLYVRVGAAVLQAAAFDLVAIATVMGMRHGRRSRWSMATAVSSALVSAAIALDVAGVMSMPWLHAANALIVLSFTLHLLAPPKEGRARQLRKLVRRLCATVRHERATVDQLAAKLRQMDEALRHARAELENVSRQPVPQEIILIAERSYSLRQIAQITEVPLTTLRRRVAQIEEQA